MKIPTLIIVFLIVCLQAIAQQSGNNATFRALYTFEYVTDTSQRNNILTETMALFANNNKSKYSSYQKIIDDSVFDAQWEEMKSTGVLASSKRKARVIGTTYHYFSNDSLYRFEDIVGTLYSTTDHVSIQWQMGNNHKTILGHDCNEATGIFRGRLYHVWFSPDISVNAGPWKLFGLPGLILSAEDSTQEIKFTCTDVSSISQQNNFLALPERYVSTTKQDLDKLRQHVQDDPIGSLREFQGVDLKPVNSNYMPPKPKPRKKLNPMELTDN